jgi:large repetitive protein
MLRLCSVPALLLSTALLAAMMPPAGAAASSATWSRELGGSSYGTAVAVGPDRDVYIAGSTNGGYPGAPEANAGDHDVFLAKFSSDGTQLWAHELGSAEEDYGLGIAVDSAGEAYVTGYTDGRLPGAATSVGFVDAFLAKYSATGSREWVDEFGVAQHSAASEGITVDRAGNAFIVGYTNGRLPGQPESNAGAFDAFIAKYSPTGARVWVHRLGTPENDYGYGIALDNAGNAYMSGDTQGSIPGSGTRNAGNGSDGFVAKYSTTGKRLWSRQLGARGVDHASAVAVDGAGNAYVTGYTNGRLPGSPGANAGGSDVFVAKYSEKGSRVWVEQFGSRGADGGNGVAVDGAGNAYVAGIVTGRVPGGPPTNFGTANGFVAEYTATGARLSYHQLTGAFPNAVATDSSGNTFTTGQAFVERNL